MRINKKRLPLYIGLIITFAYLLINLSTINDYGVTWDYTYHLNAGLWHLKTAPTVNDFVMYSWGPLGDILPTLSQIFFSVKTHLLRFDAAYNLYSLILGSLGIGLLYFFSLKLFNYKTAIFSSLTLALIPRYFGHLHNNMKDIPQAFFFTLALFSLWRLIKNPRFLNLLVAVLFFAIGFNSKFNVVFVPVIGFMWIITTQISNLANKKTIKNFKSSKFKYLFLYFILAPVTAYLFWSFFWPNPWPRLVDAFHSATTTTINMPVLYYGKTFQSGVNIPWHYPLGMYLAVIPFPMFVFSIIGIIYAFIKIANPPYSFVLIWFFLPIARFLLPNMIVIDDIRHFMEIIYPFSLLSALGFLQTLSAIKKLLNRHNNIITTIPFLYFGYLMIQIILIHPYQTNYFSEVIGGIKGAQGKFDIEFWCNGYKNAFVYINRFASNGATILVPMAPDIAKLYSRSDLKINQSNMTYAKLADYGKGEYTLVMNRESFFSWYGLNDYLAANKPVYKLSVNDTPLVSIYKN